MTDGVKSWVRLGFLPEQDDHNGTPDFSGLAVAGFFLEQTRQVNEAYWAARGAYMTLQASKEIVGEMRKAGWDAWRTIIWSQSVSEFHRCSCCRMRFVGFCVTDHGYSTHSCSGRLSSFVLCLYLWHRKRKIGSRQRPMPSRWTCKLQTNGTLSTFLSARSSQRSCVTRRSQRPISTPEEPWRSQKFSSSWKNFIQSTGRNWWLLAGWFLHIWWFVDGWHNPKW